MKTLFYDQSTMASANARMRDSGEQWLIRVNGRRSVGAYGRTKQEAYRNALKVAAETWQHHSHIFDLLAPEAV